jgi:hypothetical protein
MGNRRFSNRAVTTLAAGITGAATSLSVFAGAGAKFPVLAAGQSFRAVIQAGDLDTDAREYVLVTARATDTFTITRAQEGSSALAWSAGATIAAVGTAAGFADMLQSAGDDMSGALNLAPMVSIAAAATVDLATVPSNNVYVTGAGGPITGLGTVASGAVRNLIFASTPTLTHSASLSLPSGANIVVGAGDAAEFISSGGGVWVCRSYMRATGLPVIAPTKAAIGLGNVDNTSDASKPVSTATQTALNLKAAAYTPTFQSWIATRKATSGDSAVYYGQDETGNFRWGLQMGDAGNNFALIRYNSSGAYLSTPFYVLNSDGSFVINSGVTFNGGATGLTKAMVGLSDVGNREQVFSLRPHGAQLYMGWTGANLDVQVDGTYFGATWPIAISGASGYSTNSGQVSGVGGWAYNNWGNNPAYIWCTEGDGQAQHLTQPGSLHVANSGALSGQGINYFVNNAGSAVVNLRNSGASQMIIAIGGYGDVSWGVLGSDERLKENIAPTAEDSLAKIRQIDWKQFNYRLLESGFRVDDGRLHKLGGIAQQFHAIDPEWVHDESTWLQPNQYPMLMAAMHAISQQAEIIDELKARVAALEAA